MHTTRRFLSQQLSFLRTTRVVLTHRGIRNFHARPLCLRTAESSDDIRAVDTSRRSVDPLTAYFQEQQQNNLSLRDELTLMNEVQSLRETIEKAEEDETSPYLLLDLHNKLSLCHKQLGYLDRAVSELNKAHELIKDIYGPVSYESLQCLQDLRDLNRDVSLTDAMHCQDQIIAIKLYLHASDILLAAEWFILAELYRDASRFDESQSTLQRCISLIDDASKQANADESVKSLHANVLVQLGNVNFKKHQFAEALDAYIEANGVIPDALDADALAYAGHCALFSGHMEKAEQFFTYATERAQADGNLEKVASLSQQLGVLFATLAQSCTSKKSTQFMEYSKLAYSYTKQAHDLLVKLLGANAITQMNTSSLATAAGRLRLIYLTELMQCHLTSGTLHRALDELYPARESFEAALSLLDGMVAQFQAYEGYYMGEMALATTVLPTLKKDLAYIHSHLAEISHTEGKFDLALDLYNKAKKVAYTMTDKTNPILGTIHRNLGLMYLNQASTASPSLHEYLLADAEKELVAAQDYFAQSYPTEYHPDLADISIYLYNLYITKRNYRRAIECIEDAIDIYIVLDQGDDTRAKPAIEMLRSCASAWQSAISKRLEIEQDLSKEERTKLSNHYDYIRRKLDDTKGKEMIMYFQRLEQDSGLKLE